MSANSLVFEEDRQCKKSVNTPLKHFGPSHYPPDIHWRMIFEHKTIPTCSTTMRQWYEGPLPASLCLPSSHPVLQCGQSSRDASGAPKGAWGCTLRVKSINLSAGWKKNPVDVFPESSVNDLLPNCPK